MFIGHEFHGYTDILSSLLSEQTFHRKASSKWIQPLLKIYVYFFGIPDIGIQLRSRYFRKAIKNREFTTAFDAGCGIGINTFYLARKHPAATIDACDFSLRLFEAVKKFRDYFKLANVNVINIDLLQLAEVNKYDLIFCIDVIEHIKDDAQVLANLSRACQDGGKLIISTPYKRLKRVRIKGLRYDRPGHVRDGYSESELRALLEQAHFRVNKIERAYGTLAEYCGYLHTWILLHMPAPFAALSFPILSMLASIDVFIKVFDRYGMIVIAEKVGN
jgi:SAM-dependent methyltransferase